MVNDWNKKSIGNIKLIKFSTAVCNNSKMLTQITK